MTRVTKIAALLALLVIADFAAADMALARGGASNIMNSPGYQRRLQESRGYVTNQSGSIFSPPASPAPVPRARKHRRHH